MILYFTPGTYLVRPVNIATVTIDYENGFESVRKTIYVKYDGGAYLYSDNGFLKEVRLRKPIQVWGAPVVTYETGAIDIATGLGEITRKRAMA